MDDDEVGDGPPDAARARPVVTGGQARDLSRRALRARKWGEAVVSESVEIVGRSRSAALARARPVRPEPAVEALWLCYVSLGGSAALEELVRFLDGVDRLPPIERAILAHAAEEAASEPGPPDQGEPDHDLAGPARS